MAKVRAKLTEEAAENIRKEQNKTDRTQDKARSTAKSSSDDESSGDDRRIKGHRPRWAPDDESDDVKAMVPGYVEQEEEPIQREIQDMKDKRQSEGITKLHKQSQGQG